MNAPLKPLQLITAEEFTCLSVDLYDYDAFRGDIELEVCGKVGHCDVQFFVSLDWCSVDDRIVGGIIGPFYLEPEQLQEIFGKYLDQVIEEYQSRIADV